MTPPPVQVERRVAATPEAVYAYFTDPALWARWQGTGASFDPRPGGEFHIRMAGSDEAGARGRVVSLDPPHRIVLTWGWVEAPFGPVPAGSTTVEIELIADAGGTIVRLTHRGLPPELGEQHVAGWQLYFERLASVIVGDDPGPDPSLAAAPDAAAPPGPPTGIVRTMPPMTTTSGAARPQTADRQADDPPFYGRADLQVHSASGDGTATAVEIFDRVEALGALDVIAFTDHDDISGALAAREAHARGDYHFAFVPGIELTTRAGHVLALWVDRPIRPLRPLNETIAAIHRAGGIAVIPHPFSYLTRSIGQRALERLLRDAIPGTIPDAIEVANSSLAGRVTGAKARRLNRAHYRLTETGGSDAHFIEAVGSAFTLFPGRTAEDLRAAIAHGRTHGVLGASVPLGQIGLRRLAHQQLRGLSETPKRVLAPPLGRLVTRLRGTR